MKNILKTKMDLLAGLSKDGIAILNFENELIRKVTKALDNEIKNHPQRGWIRL